MKYVQKHFQRVYSQNYGIVLYDYLSAISAVHFHHLHRRYHIIICIEQDQYKPPSSIVCPVDRCLAALYHVRINDYFYILGNLNRWKYPVNICCPKYLDVVHLERNRPRDACLSLSETNWKIFDPIETKDVSQY